MTFFTKLLDHCNKHDLPLELRRDPESLEETWEIKVYPNGWDGGHYFSAYESLEKAAHKILVEMCVI